MGAWPGKFQGTDTQPQGLLLSITEQKHPAGTIPVLTTPLSTPSILHPHPGSPGTASSSSPARDMKPPGPCHRGHPQASHQATSRDPAAPPCPPQPPAGTTPTTCRPPSPQEALERCSPSSCCFSATLECHWQSRAQRAGRESSVVLCRAMFPWHPPASFRAPCSYGIPPFIFQAPLFLWHPPASIQRPVFLWHSTLIFQDPLFLWHPPASFQDPLFLWHSPFNLPGPSAPVASSSHSRTLCSYGTSLPAPRAPASPTLHSSGERRAQTFSQPQPHRHSPGKKPQRLRGQAPAPADGRESRHCSRQQRRRPRRAGDGDQPLSLNSGVGGIPPLQDGQGMARAQESR